jgi:hypothetical protein
VTWRVRVRPEAELDMLFAAGWYDAQWAGLGAEFIEEISALGGTAESWLHMQASHDLWLARRKMRKAVKRIQPVQSATLIRQDFDQATETSRWSGAGQTVQSLWKPDRVRPMRNLR